MRGLKSENLIGIIDFLFCGEANVLQENLDTFLALGLEELKLKGLLDSNEGTTQENIPTYMTELDELVKSMMEEGPNVISYGKGKKQKANVCKICGKEGQIVAIRDHIEANHLEGKSLPCSQCDKTFRTRVSLMHHMANIHSPAELIKNQLWISWRQRLFSSFC